MSDILRALPGYDPYRDAEGFHFDEAEALAKIEFIETALTHVKGALAGQPLLLEDWQASIVANLFGWRDDAGLRRYREALIYVPRKNGKTTLVGALVNTVLFTDGEAGAEIYSAAADRDQASICFGIARDMVLNCRALAARAKVYIKAYVFGGSTYRAISAESRTKHGYNSHMVVVDELHAQPSRDLVDVLETSTGSRTQPLVIHITTADFDRDSICNEKLRYAEQVRDGVICDPRFLPAIWAADRNDDWTDPKVWARANPNMGVSVSLEYLSRACQKAQDTPSFENTFKRLHLNITTEQAERWLQLAKWDACADALGNLEGMECYGGLDLASTRDIAAFVLLFQDGDEYAILPHFWIPRDNAVERDKRDKVPYTTWERQGFVTFTDGDVIDHSVIRRDIQALGKKYNIRQIAVDRWNAAQIITELGGDGFDMVPFGQGYASMSAPTKEFEVLVVGGKLRHGGNPVLRWMAGNVAIQRDAAENMKPAKDKSTEKIDGIVAAIMALGRAIVSEEEPESVYATRGLRSLA